MSLTIVKTKMIVCQIAKLQPELDKLMEQVESLKDLGIQNLIETIAKFKSKMENLIKESKIYNYSKKSIAKLEAMRDRFVSTIHEIIEDIKSTQQSLFDGLKGQLAELTKDIKGVNITTEIENDIEVKITDMKLPTPEDPSYQLMDVEIIPTFKFKPTATPDLASLIGDCDITLTQDMMKTAIVATPSGPGTITLLP